MARQLPPLNALRAFEAAARHLSFTKAAAELHVTPAAISHQVKALEEQLGVPLFRRLTRALRLTEAGQAALPPLREGFDRLADGVALLRAQEGGGSVTGHDVQFLYFTIGIENLSGGMGSAAFVAYLSVLCNVAYTGTQFALFTSFMAFGRTILSASSGWVVELTGWFDFFLISTIVALPGLLLLLWMMRNLPLSVQTSLQNRNHVGGIAGAKYRKN